MHVALLGVSLAQVPRAAWAHPFGDRLPAQLLEVHVEEGAITVRLTAEAPDPLWVELAGPDLPPDTHPADRLLARLGNGLYVELDGARLPLEPVHSERRTDLVVGHATLIEAAWRAPAALAGRHLLRVGNANLGDQPSWFRDEVRVPAGAVLHGTNLHKVLRGAHEDLSDRWLRSESLRRVDLDLELPSDPWSAAFRARAQPWSLDAARPQALPAAWRAGRDTPATTGLATALSLLLGVAAGLAAGWRAALPGLAAALGAAALGAPPGPLGALIAVAALGLVLDPVFALPAAVVALAWTGAAAGAAWAEATIVAALLGLALGAVSGRRPGAAAAALTAFALLAAARG